MEKRQHNFYLPPDLKWGKQRVLRSKKQVLDAEIASTNPDRRSPCSNSKSDDRLLNTIKPSTPSDLEKSTDEDDGIKEIKTKLLVHFQSNANKLMLPVVEKENEDEQATERPWNLRMRRAVCNAPAENGTVGLGGNSNSVPVLPPSHPLLLMQESQLKSRRRKGLAAPGQVEAKESRQKLRISLTKEEIEEDFLIITGFKRPRRPIKRPRSVQRQLDALFPGMWLSEVTLDMYRVSDDVDASGKR